MPKEADLIVKLEVYPLDRCVKIGKEKWWKEAQVRTTCAISSTARVGTLVKEMQKAIEVQMKKEQGPLVREEREISTWRS